MVFHPAALSATTVSLIKAIFISEYAKAITDPPFTVCITELLPYYIMVSNNGHRSSVFSIYKGNSKRNPRNFRSSGFALVMHSYYQCQHTLGICILAATKYGNNNSTVATNASNAH